MTSCAVIAVLIDQPTTRRENRLLIGSAFDPQSAPKADPASSVLRSRTHYRIFPMLGSMLQAERGQSSEPRPHFGNPRAHKAFSRNKCPRE